MATNPVRLSADDVWEMAVPPHLLGYELVDGQVVEVTPATPRHGRIAVELSRRMANYLESSGVFGHVYVDAGYVLGLARDRERMRAPDVSFVSAATLGLHGGEPQHGWFRLVPDLAIEIDSPGRKPRIERQRIQDYLDAGVRLLWVIHTDTRSATVYRADGSSRLVTEGEEIDGEDILSAFRIRLSEIF
jgi:Uma2 family endonuclease